MPFIYMYIYVYICIYIYLSGCMCTHINGTRMFKRMYSQIHKPKVIVIAGTTGVGKSQLSIQLAKRFNGEVINSDSMQVYRGLPIITNKHPFANREGIAHHVMDHVDWKEEYYLHRFEDECLKSIKEIHSRGKIPIIVGGTHYYLQILFAKRVLIGGRVPSEKEKRILESKDRRELYEALRNVDLSIANKYHPNDTRRVRRMLEIYYTSGVKPSDAFSNQRKELKFDALFLWVYSRPEELEGRLDDRVDQMLEQGGIEEIKSLHTFYRMSKFTQEQLENGIWQVIGFKEFLPWLEGNAEQHGGMSFQECADKMKLRTRQYAKRQIKWIRKMLVPDLNGNIYILDATKLDEWEATVSRRAINITESFLENNIITNERFVPHGLEFLISQPTDTSSPKNDGEWHHYRCDICRDKDQQPLIAIGKRNWELHLTSRRHRYNLNKDKKKMTTSDR
ncbi:tRNA dimethylallyltransferase Ecym_6231 [Eremothecium cymbalariae DBVPG|uniref:tRNA dimethylallyltransferase n=1 Tax=Eremothecium cymbalariae (strain CBS 270.75 / DBVPG 7215 / KCTC 17166 / NRRL Y-17582) TaxID=931890 RepID=G8JVD4_ERECY|nr:hypothetical protein Ecym_6231 [Eremothecium cymbalariae DBVPG\